jgi:hypothetical protein
MASDIRIPAIRLFRALACGVSLCASGSQRAQEIGKSGRQLIQKLAQLGRSLELGDRVREAPHRPCREFLVLRLEVQPVDLGQQTPGRVQLAIDKGRIEDQLGPLIGDLRLPPAFDLALHRFEVPLDSVDSDGKSINEIEALAVLGQDWREIAAEGHVGAHENTQACGQPQAK